MTPTIISRRIRRHPALTLAIFTTIFVSFDLYHRGTNIVTNTYILGSFRLLHGVSPYLPPEGVADWYKYSPFFSLCYAPYTFLSGKAHAILWAFTNSLFYWLGIFRLTQLPPDTSKWKWVMLVAAAMELDGSLRYQQVNVLLIGLCLMAVQDYKEGKFARAGVLLTVATNFKILPVGFLLPLFFPWKGSFIASVILTSIAVLFAPAVVVGLNSNFAFHMDWVQLILRDMNQPGLVDLRTALTILDFSQAFSNSAQFVVLGLSIIVICMCRYRDRFTPSNAWLAIVVTSLLLLSPRTESPTFVMAAPMYLLLVDDILACRTRVKYGSLICLFCSVFLITFSFNDLWPRLIWNPGNYRYATKALGVAMLWILSVSFCMSGCRYPVANASG